jgi:hypothetical protein
VGDTLRKDSYIIYIGNWSRITEVPCHSSLEDVQVRFRGNTHRAEKRRQEKSGMTTRKKKGLGPGGGAGSNLPDTFEDELIG